MNPRLVALLAVLLPAALPAAVHAQYPSRPITLIVPFPAGGPMDIVARSVAEPMARALKQPLIVDNLGGAAGAVGTLRAARAAADGYTLVLGHSGTHAFNAALDPALAYRPLEDFRPIALLATMPSLLSASHKSGLASVGELIDFARRRPGALNFGTAGGGSASHLASLLFLDVVKIDVTFIPYKGTGPAFQDLVAGRIDVLFDTAVQAVPQVQGGRVKPLAVTAGRRLDALPSVPTLGESCCASLALEIWYGLLAPRGTPQETLRLLEGAALASLADATYRNRMSQAGVAVPQADDAGREAFEAAIRRDLARFAEVARRAAPHLLEK